MINPTATHDLKILGMFGRFCLRMIKGVGHRYAVKRLLFHTIYNLRSSNIKNVINSRCYVVYMVKLGTNFPIMFYLCRPWYNQWCTGSTQVLSNQFRSLEWCCTCISPTVVIHGVKFWSTQCIQPTILFIKYINLLIDCWWHWILCQKFRDSSTHAFRRRTIVGVNIDD